MVTVSLLDRERTRDRARPRPNAPGNYITAVFFATVYSLTFAPSPENYIKWWPYVFPNTKAIGYVDEPPISPLWLPVGPVDTPSIIPNIAGSIIPGVSPGVTPPAFVPFPTVPIAPLPTFEIPQPISPAFIAPSAVGPQVTPAGAQIVANSANRPGATGTFVPGTSPSQIFQGQVPIRSVNILAPSSNLLSIHFGYNPDITIADSYPLVPGSAKDLNVDDLSTIYILAENATDKIHFEYTK